MRCLLLSCAGLEYLGWWQDNPYSFLFYTILSDQLALSVLDQGFCSRMISKRGAVEGLFNIERFNLFFLTHQTKSQRWHALSHMVLHLVFQNDTTGLFTR